MYLTAFTKDFFIYSFIPNTFTKYILIFPARWNETCEDEFQSFCFGNNGICVPGFQGVTCECPDGTMNIESDPNSIDCETPGE